MPYQSARLLVVLALASATPAHAALDCASATDLACPSTGTFSNRIGIDGQQAYGCSANTYLGREAVFRLVLTDWTDLTVTVSNTDRKARDVFILGGCDPMGACIAGGSTTASALFLAPGVYWIVVDGRGNGDNGEFVLDVSCAPAVLDVACGTRLLGETTIGRNNDFPGWSCAPATSGPERHYRVSIPALSTLVATLSNASAPGMGVIVSDPAGFNPAAPQCLAVSPTEVRLWDAQGTYYVSVDGSAGASGSYDIEIACERKLACPSPGNVIDPTTTSTVTGDTTGKTNAVETYECGTSAFAAPGVTGGYTGPEDVWEIDLAAPSQVAFLFTSASPDMRLLLLGDCYEGDCIAEGGCAELLPAGRYRLVVDGLNGASGPYSITPVIASPRPYNTWEACPECTDLGACNARPGDIRKKEWHYHSGNYCGTGCDFSLFAVVECGTEFHIPFYDVETGHMRIYDVLQSQYVDLRAVNNATGICSYSDQGTLVEWEDRGCSRIPCPAANCGGGSDCRTNNRIMDVSFEGTPNVCGVYRLDFQNWGGWEWYVYANCTADRTEQYYLYADFCSALASYRPLPEVGIADVTVDDSECASGIVSGTITLDNVGCLPAPGIQIVVSQAPPLPPNPQTIALTLGAGQQAVLPWTYPIAQRPTDLVFTVDPSNLLPECSESLGSSVSCGFSNSLVRQATRTSCPGPCTTTADAGPPLAACEGEGVTLDGGASQLLCSSPNGEYRWEDASGLPVCDWSTSPTCVVAASALPVGTHAFTLRTRCPGANPPCETSSATTVSVALDVPPASLGNTLLGARRGIDAEYRWTPPPASSPALYRLFKDGSKPVPPATRALVAEVPASTTLVLDASAIPGPPPRCGYYQVVMVGCDGVTEGPY